MRIGLNKTTELSAVIKELFGKSIDQKINGLTTDSRNLKTGDIYIALEGDIHDGHDYLDQVDKLNAAAVLINNSKEVGELNAQKIIVQDTKVALGEIAKRWRKNFNIPIIAITGSNGKTSTKELLYHVLKDKYNVHSTSGNYNTSIGLPLTMLSLSKYHDISILEMGANQLGDIGYLCSIANPTHGLITNISSAHLEGFGDIENITKTKSALFEALEEGISFVNYADNRLKKLKISSEKITYGLNETCDFPADLHHDKDGSIILTIDSNEIRTNSKNLSFAKNIIAVASIAITLGIDWKYFQDKILTFVPPKGRCKVLKYGSITVIDDTYNSNLESCSAAIDYLNAFSGKGRNIVVLGDMLELGDASEDQHRKLGDKCSSSKLDAVYTMGVETVYAHDSIENIKVKYHFEEHKDLIKTLKGHLNKNDKVLFKGSRGMEMERVIAGVFE